MFIMKKELFDQYCSFMFDVLDHFEKDTDISGYNIQQQRVRALLSGPQLRHHLVDILGVLYISLNAIRSTLGL
jgi:hypothetical protein